MQLSRVLRSMHSERNASGDSTRLLSWLAKHLDANIDTIRQELQVGGQRREGLCEINVLICYKQMFFLNLWF